MNDQMRKPLNLETLKRCVLFQLYIEHQLHPEKRPSSENISHLLRLHTYDSIRDEVGEINNTNALVEVILFRLDMANLTGGSSDGWQITEKGIRFIEESIRFTKPDEA